MKIKCLHCGTECSKAQITSHAPNTRFYNICYKCSTEIERKEFKEELAAHRAKKALDAKVARQVQAETQAEAPPEETREQVKKVVSRAELAEQARQELIQRELCRKSLLAYIRRFKPDYKAGWVHQVICKKLEKFIQDVLDRKSPRLMLFMPPRHGKSEIVSDKFPSWALGQKPELEFILTSYAATLAVGFSKVNRDRLLDPAYTQIFPSTQLDPKEQGAEYWRTTKRGGFLAAGVGGPVTGRGADVFVVDDPVKNYEEAESETVRESVKNWWRSTARTRLSPGGGVLIIQTRWHDDDLSGFLINEFQEGRKEEIPEEELEEFEIVTFPAIAERNEYIDDEYNVYYDDNRPQKPHRRVRQPGDALHPVRYSRTYLQQTKRTMGDRMFSALFQQQPVPDSGDFFRVEDFRYYKLLPEMAHRPIYFAWDLAMSTKQTGDFTVGVACMYNENGDVYVLDIVRGRWRADEITERMVDLVDRYKRQNLARIGVEQGTIWNAVRENFRKKMRDRDLNITIDETLRPVTDKRVRARPLQAWMQSGRIRFPENQPWVEQARQELLRFDAGVHDDVVDAMAWMVQMLQMQPPPDIARMRMARDSYAVDKARLVRDYMREQAQKKKSDKEFMAS